MLKLGFDVNARANDGGTAGSMSSVGGAYCTVDETAPLNNYGAIRTSSYTREAPSLSWIGIW